MPNLHNTYISDTLILSRCISYKQKLKPVIVSTFGNKKWLDSLASRVRNIYRYTIVIYVYAYNYVITTQLTRTAWAQSAVIVYQSAMQFKILKNIIQYSYRYAISNYKYSRLLVYRMNISLLRWWHSVYYCNLYACLRQHHSHTADAIPPILFVYKAYVCYFNLR